MELFQVFNSIELINLFFFGDAKVPNINMLICFKE